MGFLDKVKSTVEQTTKAAQGKLDDVQSKKRADQLLRDLGAWYYASRTGAPPEAGANIERLIGELQAHEAEHGPINVRGADDATTAPAAPSAPSLLYTTPSPPDKRQ
jgi:hypothetical protein